MSDKTKKAIRIAALVIFALVMIGLTVLCWPVVKMLSSEEGREKLEFLVRDNIVLGIIVFVLLQVLQVVVALIPGAVIQILGGVLFGGFWGTVLCFAGTLLGEVAVFYLVKRLGMPIIEALSGEDGIKQFSFLKDSKKCELAVFILFLLPLPKDALTYFAPLTKMKPSTFFVLSMAARTPAIIVSNIFGSSLSQGNTFIAVAIFIAVAVIGIVCILYKDRIMDALRRRIRPHIKAK